MCSGAAVLAAALGSYPFLVSPAMVSPASNPGLRADSVSLIDEKVTETVWNLSAKLAEFNSQLIGTAYVLEASVVDMGSRQEIAQQQPAEG